MPSRHPPRLQPGQTIGIAAPASYADPEAITRAVHRIEASGFRVRLATHVNARHRYLAGRDDDRLADLQACLTDPDIHAVLFVRGGYGTQRLLPRIDRAALAATAPKIILGYSDLTTLHGYLQRHCGWTTFYGPTVAHHLGTVAEADANWHAALRAIATPEPLGTLAPTGVRIIKPGTATGILRGGNLAMLQASIGTDYFPPLDDAICLLEDRGEKLYRLDRMLTQLHHVGAFRHVRGICFGSLALPSDEPNPQELDAMLRERFADFPGPILAGLPIGHCDPCLTVPLGVSVRVTTDPAGVEFLESGVI